MLLKNIVQIFQCSKKIILCCHRLVIARSNNIYYSLKLTGDLFVVDISLPLT